MATANSGTGHSNGAGEGGTVGAPNPAGGDEVPQKRRSRRTERKKEREASEPKERALREEPNSIRASRLRSRVSREEPAQAPGGKPDPSAQTREQPLGASDGTPPASPRKPGVAESDPWTVPQSVRDRFAQDGHRFYFPDGKPAFRDHGRKLTTQSENTELIHSLVQIANARGWQEITVDGTERFREEAWRQGRLAGLNVRGYKPSEAERASVIRSLARNAENARTDAALPPSTAAPSAASSAGGEPPPAGASGERKRPDDLIVGKLIDHGREPYRFDPHEEMSYFVRIETPEGKRTLWGKDLQRAMTKSLTQPQIGDEIAMRRTGAENVTVKRRERDAEGQVRE